MKNSKRCASICNSVDIGIIKSIPYHSITKYGWLFHSRRGNSFFKIVFRTFLRFHKSFLKQTFYQKNLNEFLEILLKVFESSFYKSENKH